MRRAKGFEWILLAAVLAVPAFLFGRWSSEIKKTAAPATRPTRIVAITVPKIVSPPIEAPREPLVAARPVSPVKPPEPPPAEVRAEAVLLAMRDPMLSPFDHIRIIQDAAPPEEPVVPPPPPPPRVDAGIRLEGVILTDDQPRRAIVNGAVLEEGGTVKGARVLKISADGVIFGKGRARFTKRLID